MGQNISKIIEEFNRAFELLLKFDEIIELMMKLLVNGNYLNYGSATSQKGVTLDAIEKANDLKTIDNKKTLLIYLIENYEDPIIIKDDHIS